MKRTTFLAAALATTLAWAAPSAADTIGFDIDGGGGTAPVNATVFDWAPGNALLIESVAPTQTTPGSGQILFQANLNTVLLDDASTLGNGTGGSFITIVAAFNVTLTAIGDVAAANTQIDVVPGGGTIRIYADAERGNNLTGVGFAADPGAINILTATITSGGGTFDADPLASVTSLDAFLSAFGAEPDGNNYPNVFTLTGRGGSDITAVVTQVNNAYFTNLVIGSSMAFTNTSTIDPYNQANPSNFFSPNTINDATFGPVLNPASPLLCGVNLGGACINGTGSWIIAQADANTAFTIAPGEIPEPATLTLLGLGLIGVAAARRRRATK